MGKDYLINCREREEGGGDARVGIGQGHVFSWFCVFCVLCFVPWMHPWSKDASICTAALFDARSMLLESFIFTCNILFFFLLFFFCFSLEPLTDGHRLASSLQRRIASRETNATKRTPPSTRSRAPPLNRLSVLFNAAY